MLRKIVICFLVFLIGHGFLFPVLYSQQSNYNPKYPPNTFRSADNPHYWKNKKPFEGYWQQDVHYKIKAEIDEKLDIIIGEEKLTYWNNSPRALEYVYFHLYQNAFQPGSYYDDLQRNNKIKPRYGHYESIQLGTEIDYIASEGKVLKAEYDNTLVKVFLDKPIAPGDSIVFDIEFTTYFDIGSVRRRMKYFKVAKYKHYNGVHWYPRISAYDRKFGWTTDQHLGREYYADFGTFDVELTFANNMVVEATGNLLNRSEVMPDTLRDRLDLRHFKDKPWNDPPSEVIPYDSSYKKTWHFYAENVHDFAFTADPAYRIGEAEWNGVRAVAMVMEQHASGWQNAAQYAADIIRVLSEDFGMYEYHKIIVADARDGMEYVMLTLDTGRDPSYRGLLVHEIGHNWFFGMIGNNETYRASLDEGFTQFATAHGLERLDGKYRVRNEIKNKYVRKFREPIENRDARVYIGYLSDALQFKDQPLNTHSDGFNGAIRQGGGYRHVYYKTAAMLYNLQYTLGDSLFWEAMQYYVETWKFCHPYLIDMRTAFIDYTGVDLNWFFDQWLETTKVIDYKVQSVNKKGKDGTYHIKFKRKERMQMPIDFRVISKTGDTSDYHIPNTWFQKETDATILPKWYGWDKLHPAYTAEIKVPGGVKDVIIDPSKRLADIYMLDNSKRSPTQFNFDSKIRNYRDWKRYQFNIRPDVWYNSYDGLKAGIHFNSHYMRKKHVMEFWAWANTRVFQGDFNDDIKRENDPFSFIFRYQNAIDKVIKGGTFYLDTRNLDGLSYNTVGLKKRFTKKVTLGLEARSMFRAEEEDKAYLLYPDEWNADRYNNSINLHIHYPFTYKKGRSTVQAGLRSSSLWSDYDYHYFDAEWINHYKLGKLDLRSRVYGRVGSGSDLAPESALFAYGANPEALMENKFTRSRGFFKNDWVGDFGPETNQFHHGGGLNLRGYAGYYMVERDAEDNTVLAYSGQSGASVNLEVGFDRFFRIQSAKVKKYFDMDLYLFGDVGTIVYNNSIGEEEFSNIRADAGIGAAFTIKKFWVLDGIKPFTIRMDFPLLLSHTPAADPDYFQFRWVIGVNRAF